MDDARRSYAVIGSGAIGGFYGAHLAAAGHAVQFVARSDAPVLSSSGLRVRTTAGPDIEVPAGSFSAVASPEAATPADVVLLTVKTTANGHLRELLAPFDRPDVIVVVMQNGLGVDDAAAAAAPHATVLGGLCFICAQRSAPGLIDHLDYGGVTLAEWSSDGRARGVTPAVEAVQVDLTGAGIDATPRPDLVAARWQKLMWNVPYNGLSVVLDASTEELMADASSRSLVTQLMAEVEAASIAVGHPVGPGFGERMRANTLEMVPYAPSMKLDFDAGRPLEVEAIYDVPIATAAAAGAAMPTAHAVAQQLHFLDARSRAGSTRGFGGDRVSGAGGTSSATRP